MAVTRNNQSKLRYSVYGCICPHGARLVGHAINVVDRMDP